MTTQYLKRLLKYDQQLPKKATIPKTVTKKRKKSTFTTENLEEQLGIETNYQTPKLLGREGGIFSPFALKNIETKFRQKNTII